MQNVIYIDMLFLINALIGYFTLRAAAAICKSSSNTVRMILASVLAGFSSFVIFAPDPPDIAVWIYKLSTCFLICSVAFEVTGLRVLFKRIFWYVFINLGLAGTVFAAVYYLNVQGMHSNNLAVYFNISPPVLILCVVAVYLCVKLCGFMLGAPNKYDKAVISFVLSEKPCKCNALVDTGFCVKDIMGGKKVFMLSLPMLENMLSKELFMDLSLYFKGEVPKGDSFFFIINVNTANGAKALPAVKAVNLEVNLSKVKVRHKEAAAVFTEERLGSGEFEALIGTDLLN